MTSKWSIRGLYKIHMIVKANAQGQPKERRKPFYVNADHLRPVPDARRQRALLEQSQLRSGEEDDAEEEDSYVWDDEGDTPREDMEVDPMDSTPPQDDTQEEPDSAISGDENRAEDEPESRDGDAGDGYETMDEDTDDAFASLDESDEMGSDAAAQPPMPMDTRREGDSRADGSLISGPTTRSQARSGEVAQDGKAKRNAVARAEPGSNARIPGGTGHTTTGHQSRQRVSRRATPTQGTPETTASDQMEGTRKRVRFAPEAPQATRRSKRIRKRRQEQKRRDLSTVTSFDGKQDEIVWQSDAESDQEEELHELATIMADAVEQGVGRTEW